MKHITYTFAGLHRSRGVLRTFRINCRSEDHVPERSTTYWAYTKAAQTYDDLRLMGLERTTRPATVLPMEDATAKPENRTRP